jgi:hypothetical protein
MADTYRDLVGGTSLKRELSMFRNILQMLTSFVRGEIQQFWNYWC